MIRAADRPALLRHDRQLLELAINHFNPERYTYRFQMRATRT